MLKMCLQQTLETATSVLPDLFIALVTAASCLSVLSPLVFAFMSGAAGNGRGPVSLKGEKAAM